MTVANLRIKTDVSSLREAAAALNELAAAAEKARAAMHALGLTLPAVADLPPPLYGVSSVTMAGAGGNAR